MLWLLFGTVVVVCMLSATYSLSGQWERIPDGAATDFGVPKERFTLTQIGPVVYGRGSIAGGEQRFFGLTVATHVWLWRRDYGQGPFHKQGFPPELIPLLQGRCTAKLHLVLSADRFFVSGHFFPKRIEFEVDPPRLLMESYTKPQVRQYRRIAMIEAGSTLTTRS
jgi:hypothetical protein